MDARTAKREACGRVASLTRGALEVGWELDAHYSPADATKVEQQILKLIEELERRSDRP